MANVVKDIWSIPELRKRILFTIGCLAIFRIGAQIPVPGIDAVALDAYYQSGWSGGGFLAFLNLFSGGALMQFSLMALGIMPYISSSIIMQLLQVVVPSLERLQKEGPEGRKKIQMYTRYGTIVLCFVQAFGLLIFLKQIVEAAYLRNNLIIVDGLVEGGGYFFQVLFLLTTTAGTMVLLWLGEQISERGIGNGVSLMIFAGIIARMPYSTITMIQSNEVSAIEILILLVIFVLVIGLVTTEQQAVRKIPVRYAKRVVGNKMYGAGNTHIPFKINPSGVIPVIFAASIIIFPNQILSMIGGTDVDSVFHKIANALSPGEFAYVIVYLLLVIAFAFFYTQIYFNPTEIAENMQKQGGDIPGIRPGEQTATYLQKVLNRITLPGAIFLGLVAVFPDVISSLMNLPRSLSFVYLMGGTSLIIMVGVGLDTISQIESHLMMRNYSGFLRKGRVRGRYTR